MRGEDLVGLPPKKKVEGPREHFTHRVANRLVEIRNDPAAMLEAPNRIFARSAWRLHDPVEAEKRTNDHLPHLRAPRSGRDCATSSICWIMVPQPSRKPMS